jgi:hypothetical protein
MQQFMDQRGYGRLRNLLEHFSLGRRSFACWRLEGTEAFSPNPFSVHFQRVYADLGVVMVVAAV